MPVRDDFSRAPVRGRITAKPGLGIVLRDNLPLTHQVNEDLEILVERLLRPPVERDGKLVAA